MEIGWCEWGEIMRLSGCWKVEGCRLGDRCRAGGGWRSWVQSPKVEGSEMIRPLIIVFEGPGDAHRQQECDRHGCDVEKIPSLTNRECY